MVVAATLAFFTRSYRKLTELYAEAPEQVVKGARERERGRDHGRARPREGPCRGQARRCSARRSGDAARNPVTEQAHEAVITPAAQSRSNTRSLSSAASLGPQGDDPCGQGLGIECLRAEHDGCLRAAVSPDSRAGLRIALSDGSGPGLARGLDGGIVGPTGQGTCDRRRRHDREASGIGGAQRIVEGPARGANGVQGRQQGGEVPIGLPGQAPASAPASDQRHHRVHGPDPGSQGGHVLEGGRIRDLDLSTGVGELLQALDRATGGAMTRAFAAISARAVARPAALVAPARTTVRVEAVESVCSAMSSTLPGRRGFCGRNPRRYPQNRFRPQCGAPQRHTRNARGARVIVSRRCRGCPRSTR